MTRQTIEQINEERLRLLAKRLADSHATPVLVIGVGHGRVSGQISVITTEDPQMTNEVLAAFCQYAAFHLENRT